MRRILRSHLTCSPIFVKQFSTSQLRRDSDENTTQNSSKNAYNTGIPAVEEFWNTCVRTPHVSGPNVALSKVRKVSDQLQAAEDAKSSPSSSGDSGGLAMSKQDAVLHATMSSRTVLLSPPSDSSSAASSLLLPLPEFIYRRKTKEIQNEAEKIYNAYQEYYNHIKFRNGWEKPALPKDDPLTSELLREAADICARIRARLDEENPTTKLRQADGSAQAFFNSPDAAKMFEAVKAESESNKNQPASQLQRREFVKNVVLNTFKDAMGFVEGLTKTKLERYFYDISDFGFNPSAHVQHLLLEMLAAAEVARLSFDVADAVKYSHESFGIVSQEQAPKSTQNADGSQKEPHPRDEKEPSTNNDSSSSPSSVLPPLLPPTVSRKAHDKARLSRDNVHFCEEDGAEDKAWRDAISKLYKAHDALLVAMNERKKNAIKHIDVKKRE